MFEGMPIYGNKSRPGQPLEANGLDIPSWAIAKTVRVESVLGRSGLMWRYFGDGGVMSLAEFMCVCVF